MMVTRTGLLRDAGQHEQVLPLHPTGAGPPLFGQLDQRPVQLGGAVGIVGHISVGGDRRAVERGEEVAELPRPSRSG